jgi:hypothetical protein
MTHNPKVEGSNPSPPPTKHPGQQGCSLITFGNSRGGVDPAIAISGP